MFDMDFGGRECLLIFSHFQCVMFWALHYQPICIGILQATICYASCCMRKFRSLQRQNPQETLYLLVLALEYWHFECILYDICRIIVDFHFVQMLIVILCPLLLSIMRNNSLMRNIAGMCLICWSSRTENCCHFILHFCNVRKRSLLSKDHCNLKLHGLLI
jgi:hypothetical protein